MLNAVGEHLAPIAVIVVLAEEGDCVVLVEKRAETPGDLVRRLQQSMIVPSEIGRDPVQGAERTDCRAAESDIYQEVNQRVRYGSKDAFGRHSPQFGDMLLKTLLIAEEGEAVRRADPGDRASFRHGIDDGRTTVHVGERVDGEGRRPFFMWIGVSQASTAPAAKSPEAPARISASAPSASILR